MKYIMIALALMLLVLPLVSADIPSPPNPTVKTIAVTSTITNINDFPDYVFVSFGGYGPCHPQVIGSDGVIIRAGGYGNYCTTVSVYAIKKTDFDKLDLSNDTEVEGYFNSSKAIRVIQNAQTFLVQVPITSTKDSITNYYNISLNTVQIDPSKQEIKRDYTLYYYLLIPLAAIIILIVILVRRRKNA
jgi:hypothetical protein